MVREDRRARAREGARLEMTPMIDVTFLLIIFFLCLRFKTLEGKLGAYLPKDIGGRPGDPARLEKLDVQIRLLERGTAVAEGRRKQWTGRKIAWVVRDQTYTDIASLERGLRRFREVLPNSKKPGEPVPVTVHAYSGVFYGEVTRTVDVVLSDSVGFKEVTFAGGRP